MAMNPELEVKALNKRVDGLERTIDTMEKSIRAMPDLSKLSSRIEALEKAMAGKKDAKTAEQEDAKLIKQIVENHKTQTQAMVDAVKVENRLVLLEALVNRMR